MARTMTRRPGTPTRVPLPPPPAAPAAKVPARRTTHVRDATLTAAAGLAGYGAAPLLGHPGLDVAALGLGLTAAAGIGVTGERKRRRQELEDRIAEELAAAEDVLVDAPLTPDGVDGLRATARAIAWRDV